MNNLVVSFICPDRPGIVENLSNLVKKHHGNWQTSSLHHLSGFFTGVIEISISAEHANPLLDALLSLPEFKCNIEVVVPAKAINSEADSNFVLELTANDRTGIIQEISAIIHHQDGNLIKLVSQQSSAPHSGQDLFKATATISVDANVIEQLISALEGLADDLMVDISR